MWLAAVWQFARRDAQPVCSAHDLLAALEPVDLAAFRNLISTGETAFLRAHLPSRDFRRVQRARLRAAAHYVARTAHNAAVLLSACKTESKYPDPAVARAAQALATDALRLRISSRLALALLYLRGLGLDSEMGVGQVLDTYVRVREDTVRLSRLRMPTLASRIEAAL